MPLANSAFLALLAAALPQDPPAQPDPAQTAESAAATQVTIGTWNIEFLGADPKLRRDTAPRSEDDYRKIGAYVRDLGVAALGVQEICGLGALSKVAAAAGPTWRAVLGTSGQWTDGKTQQGVGFLYDARDLLLLHCEEFLDFPSERDGVNVFHRKPVTACFRHIKSGADFRLVVVHMKAGRKDRDRQKRRAEALTLREWIQQQQDKANEDQDIAILGDFNCTYGDAPEKILTESGAATYLQHAEAGPTILWFDEPIDQIVVGSSFSELAGQPMQAHRVLGEPARLAYRQTFSDHFACTATLQLQGDDDPDAKFSRGPSNQWLPVARRPTNPAVTQPPEWPIAVGQRVRVYVTHVTHQPFGEYEGVLQQPIPATSGWVVIKHHGVIHAFSSENVVLIKPIK